MKRKALALTLIPTLLTLALVETLLVDSAYANFMPLNIPPHSIEIMADGNVTGTDNIKRIGIDYEFTANISGSIVVFCDNITINGNGYSLTGNGDLYGIFLEGRKNVIIKNLTINNFGHGVAFSYGGWLNGDCKGNVLMANNIINNKWGIFCYQVSNITVSGNILSNNSGAGISGFNSEQIQIYGNMLSNNNITVRFTYCQNSNVYGNNFINNTSTRVDPESNSGLIFGWSTINWNNRRLGNFWSNYEGADANKDGIGDTPYVIDEKNQDNYPLMYPYDIEKDTIAFSEPFPTFVIAAFVIVAVIVGAGLLVYWKKRKRGGELP